MAGLAGIVGVLEHILDVVLERATSENTAENAYVS